MGAITVFGHELDDGITGRLRAIAERADELAEELAGLDPVLLTPLTLSRSPGYIAGRLREVAALIERKQRGESGFAGIFGIVRAGARQKMIRELDDRARRQAALEMGLGDLAGE